LKHDFAFKNAPETSAASFRSVVQNILMTGSVATASRPRNSKKPKGLECAMPMPVGDSSTPEGRLQNM
jgi:hypothetical protein